MSECLSLSLTLSRQGPPGPTGPQGLVGQPGLPVCLFVFPPSLFSVLKTKRPQLELKHKYDEKLVKVPQVKIC